MTETAYMPDGTEFFLADWWRYCPVQRKVQVDSIYEEAETAFVQKHANLEWTFLDFGAHVGYFSVLAAPLFKRVIAIEPHPKNFEALLVNTERFSNVTAINMAVYDHDGTVSMDLPENSTVMSNVRPAPTGETPEKARQRVKGHTTVECQTLRTILGDTFPEFIKADAEGSEEAIFRACPEYLDRAKALVVEYHEKQLMRSSNIQSGRVFIDLLAEHGFSNMVYSERGVEVDPTQLPPPNGPFVNLIGVK